MFNGATGDAGGLKEWQGKRREECHSGVCDSVSIQLRNASNGIPTEPPICIS